jgi:hypothetical protein
MSCAENTVNEEKHFIGAVNVKQNCVWMGVSKAIIQISGNFLHAYIGCSIITYSSLCEKL